MGVCISNNQPAQPEITIDEMTAGQLNIPIESFQSLAVEPRRGDRKRQAKIEVIVEQIHENVIRQEKEKSPFDFQMILNAFGNHFMFAQLENNDKTKLIEEMYYVTSKDQEFIFKQGDKATLFFIIGRFDKLFIKKEVNVRQQQMMIKRGY
ncbi:unnamed protein product [Paramecium sonneborni]|uniref:Cyclic nucleotide-binding domain-containing protein n=1 Tax=Paramecium sonneborni TaxID=65129 RepID=A0A8S1PCA7_9CILI|nr:unnamed protein product [Paramecium sonneborni]